MIQIYENTVNIVGGVFVCVLSLNSYEISSKENVMTPPVITYRSFQVIEIIGDISKYLVTFDGDELPETFGFALMKVHDFMKANSLRSNNSKIESVGATTEKGTEYLAGYHLYGNANQIVFKAMIEAYR